MGTETGSHLSNQAGQRGSEVQSLPPTSQSRHNKKQNGGGGRYAETRSQFRPVTVTPSGVLPCKHRTLALLRAPPGWESSPRALRAHCDL